MPDGVVIDCHQHVGSLRAMAIMAPAQAMALESEATKRRVLMRELAITHAVVMPAFEYGTLNGAQDVINLNDEIIDYCEANADFALKSMAILDPLAMNDMPQELERLRTKRQIAGVVWHNRFQRVPINTRSIMSTIADRDAGEFLWAFHCVGDSRMEAPWRLEKVAETFPAHNFLALSSLSGPTQSGEMLAICKRRPNIYLELGAMFPLGLWIEHIVKKIGSERLLFGSDLYTEPVLFRHNYALMELRASHISELAKENISSNNAKRLFGLE